MTISNLIEVLHVLKEGNGDIEVYFDGRTREGLRIATPVSGVCISQFPKPVEIDEPFVLLKGRSKGLVPPSFIINETSLPPEADEVINENFWDLVIGEPKPKQP
jgi:hypothetical protein